MNRLNSGYDWLLFRSIIYLTYTVCFNKVGQVRNFVLHGLERQNLRKLAEHQYNLSMLRIPYRQMHLGILQKLMTAYEFLVNDL